MQQQVIDPAELDIPQLEQFKGGLQAELQSIQGAIEEMSKANESLMMAQLSCDQVKDTILEKDLEVMVPMTGKAPFFTVIEIFLRPTFRARKDHSRRKCNGRSWG